MQTIHTVGTTDMTFRRFIGLLREHRINAVIDIRLRNEGPRYRFASGCHLRELTASQGVAYRHELRFAPTPEMLTRFKADHDWPPYVAAYGALIRSRDMLAVWREIARTFERPCLLCAEKSAQHCHRQLLAAALADANGLTVTHL